MNKFLAKEDWVPALSKASTMLDSMMVPGVSSTQHASAKEIIKLVAEAISLELAKEKEVTSQMISKEMQQAAASLSSKVVCSTNGGALSP